MSKLPQASAADPIATLPLVRRLLSEYAPRYWKHYAAAFSLMAIVACATAATAYLIGEVINQAYLHRDSRAIALLSLATVAIFVAKGAASYGQSVILARIANRIVAENQRRMFAKLLTESIGFFAQRHSSEFMARLNYGASSASNVLNLLITSLGRDLLTLIGLIGVMVYQDPVLSMVGLIVVPPAILVLRKLIRRVKTVAYTQFAGGARILETLQETLQGMRIVKAFTLEDEMQRRVLVNIESVEQASNKMARVANRSSPLMETLGGVAIAAAMLYTGYRVVETGAAPGEFFSFITAFLLAYEPAKRLARLNIDLSSSLVGVRILFELLDSPATEPDDTYKPPLKVTQARVEFRRVTFGYRPNEPVLREFSLMAEPGRVTALVGPSGGGKSTVLNLLLRFYDPQDGAVLIDEQDTAALRRASVRSQIGYVGQDVFLFRGSVRENIAYGRPNAADAEIEAAAKAAFAHDFITAFPAGYDTPVGEHGHSLSGGQRQRIAIARALIKDAPIILLDEATAALDAESEQQVQEALARLCAGRTTLVIAHRLSTIQHADRIHVIEAGRVTESGRHDELLRRNGRYASFYRLQLQEQPQEPEATVA
jgi:ATP-binding cassette subfamily B protein